MKNFNQNILYIVLLSLNVSLAAGSEHGDGLPEADPTSAPGMIVVQSESAAPTTSTPVSPVSSRPPFLARQTSEASPAAARRPSIMSRLGRALSRERTPSPSAANGENAPQDANEAGTPRGRNSSRGTIPREGTPAPDNTHEGSPTRRREGSISRMASAASAFIGRGKSADGRKAETPPAMPLITRRQTSKAVEIFDRHSIIDVFTRFIHSHSMIDALTRFIHSDDTLSFFTTENIVHIHATRSACEQFNIPFEENDKRYICIECNDGKKSNLYCKILDNAQSQHLVYKNTDSYYLMPVNLFAVQCFLYMRTCINAATCSVSFQKHPSNVSVLHLYQHADQNFEPHNKMAIEKTMAFIKNKRGELPKEIQDLFQYGFKETAQNMDQAIEERLHQFAKGCAQSLQSDQTIIAFMKWYRSSQRMRTVTPK